MRVLRVLAFALLGAVPAVLGVPCRKQTDGIKSYENGGKQVNLKLTNSYPFDVEIHWVNFAGEEIYAGESAASHTAVHNSYTGHVFRIRKEDGSLVDEFRVSNDMEVSEEKRTPLEIPTLEYVLPMCGEVLKPTHMLYNAGRDVEFTNLTHDQSAACVGDASKWSCVRHVSKSEIAARDKHEFGFQPEELVGHAHSGRRAYQTKDDTYYTHIPGIPFLTPNEEGNGFLKMNMTKAMQEILFDYFKTKYGTPAQTQHETIAGYYSNNHHVAMDKVDLDKYPAVRRIIVREMHQVLQWWTLRKLTHTSTFGMRIYREGSMLINHVDRADTHLASAVLQVHQNCPDGKAWPLEVQTTDGELYEVYLQPGEMVLYEGARLFHGRPKRSQCSEFSNIFTHFAPLGFAGPNKIWDDKKSEVPGVTPRVVPAKD